MSLGPCGGPVGGGAVSYEQGSPVPRIQSIEAGSGTLQGFLAHTKQAPPPSPPRGP